LGIRVGVAGKQCRERLGGDVTADRSESDRRLVVIRVGVWAVPRGGPRLGEDVQTQQRAAAGELGIEGSDRTLGSAVASSVALPIRLGCLVC